MVHDLRYARRDDGRRVLKSVLVIVPFSEIMEELETSSIFLEEMSGMGAKELVEFFFASWTRAIDVPTGKLSDYEDTEWKLRNIRLMAYDVMMANLEKSTTDPKKAILLHHEWELGFRHVWNLLSSEIIAMLNTITPDADDVLPEVKFHAWLAKDLVLELPGHYLGK